MSAPPTITRTPTRTDAPTPSPTDVSGLPGDGNCDGRLTAADLTAIVLRFDTPPGTACPLVDFNQDGIVNGTDLEDTTYFEFINVERLGHP